MHFFDFPKAIFSNFRPSSRNLPHAYVSAFSKRFFGLNSSQGLQLTTDTKESHLPLFWGETFWSEQSTFGKFGKKQFFVFYTKTVANSGFWSAPLERIQKIQPETKEVEPFRKVLVIFLSTFLFNQNFKCKRTSLLDSSERSRENHS